MPLRAVILVPDGQADQPTRQGWRAECVAACEREGYDVAGFAATWHDAVYTLRELGADIIMAAEDDHFPPDRVPRTETPRTPPQRVNERPKQRRARWLNRRDE